LYADTEIKHDISSAGRQMNAHFATKFVNENGDWLDLSKLKNVDYLIDENDDYNNDDDSDYVEETQIDHDKCCYCNDCISDRLDENPGSARWNVFKKILDGL
jgi:hypothetical protein